ncbi:glutaredoxin [Tricholoma matsutake]|nr:glutaredoxin [Tricholoma matsutake 945]
MAVKDFVESTIVGKKVVIFSKSWCPYSGQTKALFAREFQELEPVIVEIDGRDDEAEIQDYLQEKTGQRTVPNVFINEKHIGGNDKVQAAFKSGDLAQLISQSARL